MKTNVLRFALFPLLALSALALRPSACAQGTVSLPASATDQVWWDDWRTGSRSPVAVGNPAYIPGYGQINIQVYYAPVGTVSPFTADGASMIPAPWAPSSTPPLHQIGPFAGWTPLYEFTLPTAIGGASVEVMVVGWTGDAPDWNSSQLGPGKWAWTGFALSGGALAWVNGTGNPNASPPTKPVPLLTGLGGYNGLVFWSIPEPCSLSLAGLGAVMLMLFRRRS